MGDLTPTLSARPVANIVLGAKPDVGQHSWDDECRCLLQPRGDHSLLPHTARNSQLVDGMTEKPSLGRALALAGGAGARTKEAQEHHKYATRARPQVQDSARAPESQAATASEQMQ